MKANELEVCRKSREGRQEGQIRSMEDDGSTREENFELTAHQNGHTTSSEGNAEEKRNLVHGRETNKPGGKTEKIRENK